MANKIYKLSDQEIENRINNRLYWDKRVSRQDITVEVESGVATVTGTVDSSFRKNAALEIVSSADGIWSVKDYVQVPNDYYRSDREIQSLLEKQLANLDFHPEEFINVDVADGVVKLEGEVSRPRLKAFAVGLAWELSGVHDVLNLIEVLDEPHLSADLMSRGHSLFGMFNYSQQQ